ncbi:MAG: endonuclease [Thermaurantimonas sp.]|uniref:endonuclease n=1 Tax=Thermaurantimonas sp. TaxID=2681568 RepID=UPI00391D3ABF
MHRVKLSGVLFFAFFYHNLFSQSLTIQVDSLWFPPTEYGDTVVGSFVIVNQSSSNILLKSVEIGKAYNDRAFTLATTPTVIPPGTLQLIVRFHPLNDIYYRVPLILRTVNAGGDYTVLLTGQGKFVYSIGQHTENKTGLALKQALATYQSNHTNLGYNGARDLMYSKLDNINGWVTCLYTGRMAQFNTRAGAVSNNFNAEHVFPQSFFNQNDPMRSDLNHLYSTDETANNIRSNHPYGIITGTPTWQNNGSKYLSSVFEPRDSAKGRVARALLYFVLRYQDYSNFVAPQENLLRTWHFQHMPDAMDRRRDSIIAVHQGKHNVFIKYPYILHRINSLTGSADFPNAKSFQWSSDTILTNTSLSNIYFSLWNQGYYPLTIDSIKISASGGQFSISQLTVPAFSAARCTLSLPASLPSGFYTAIAYSGSAQKTLYLNHTSHLGWNEISTKQTIALYPNPADERLNVETNMQVKTLEIFSLLGEKVFEGGYEPFISTKYLPAGGYILIVKDLFGNQFAKKFVVSHR